MRNVLIICLFLGLASCSGQEKRTHAFENVSVEKFQQLIKAKNAQLIDVRTPGEYEKGHLKDAMLIDFMNSNFKDIAFSEVDKDKPILVYCASGGRSAKAAKIYKDAGFVKVYNLLGGFRAWKAKKLEIAK